MTIREALVGLAKDLKKHHGDVLASLAPPADAKKVATLPKALAPLYRWHDGSDGAEVLGDYLFLSAKEVAREQKKQKRLVPFFHDQSGNYLCLDPETGRIVDSDHETAPVDAYESLEKLVLTMRAAAKKGVLVGDESEAREAIYAKLNPGYPRGSASEAHDLKKHAKDPAKGLRLVDAALKRAPDDHELHQLAYDFADAKGDDPRTLAALAGSARTAPQPAMRFRLGIRHAEFLIYLERFDEAAAAVKTLLAKPPKEADSDDLAAAWEASASANRRAGHEAAALSAYREAVKHGTLASSRGDSWRWIADLSEGKAKKQAMDRAIACFEEWLGMNAATEQSADVNYNLACAYAVVGKRDAALSKLARAIELDPETRSDAKGDSDFESIAAAPAFRALLVAKKKR